MAGFEVFIEEHRGNKQLARIPMVIQRSILRPVNAPRCPVQDLPVSLYQ